LIIFIFNSKLINAREDSTLVETISINKSNIEASYFKIGKKIFKSPIPRKTQKANRGVAITLTVLTGVVGGHRVYLGTEPLVVGIYALTAGGAVIVFVIDLVHLAIVKDISQFENNDKIFMWIKD